MTTHAHAFDQNVDPSEIHKFSDIAHQWWDLNGHFKPLHQINPLRLAWIEKHSQIHHKNMIDVGCGGGILSEGLAKAGANVLGIDLADKSLKVAKLHALESNLTIQYEHIAAEALAEKQPHSADVVTCMEMLEHVPNPQSIIQACATLVKPGGWVFMSTIHRKPKAFLMAILAAEYLLNMVPRGTHEYSKLLKPSEIAAMARTSNLALVSQIGLHLNPLSQQFYLSHSNVDVNYMMAFRKMP